MIEALEESVRARGKPFVGICVGLQLMAERGLEHGITPGLGWIEGEVRAISPRDSSLKIPHMGWNTLKLAREHARDLRTEASQRRLARLASCCRPSYLAARLTELRERLTRRDAVAACCT